MRKAQKKQAEGIVKLLGRAHIEIKRSVEAGKTETAMDLLEQCQGAAIELGNMIESEEGEGFVTVSLLEKYCELTYEIHETLWDGQSVNRSKICKSLRKSLIQIENSVKNDIQEQIEAVFLPYKASMWDSLESVWKAAEDDPECRTYVIPIPYYDKEPDGSFGEMHYEGDLYPEYVPITNYKNYDFEGRRPDMIFIHNPYDNCNYVTSVAPFFYSANLKRFTDNLVYIPYFILAEPNPDDPNTAENIEHFCTCPGVIYADKVIVQSENMRRVYVDVMTKFASESGYTRKYWEDKILGIGSPKIDRVLDTKKAELEVPEEWAKIIRKNDGSWKKVILYNTGVTALLQHGEQYLNKMRDVFHILRENQGEIALLWRPHPLIRATIKSMRPQLYEAYERLLEEYLRDAWGIYDDSPDIDRAVMLADGYYGDFSSVVQLCQKAGVPVMIQNVEIIDDLTERN